MKATLKENEEKIVSVSELNNGGAGKFFWIFKRIIVNILS